MSDYNGSNGDPVGGDPVERDPVDFRLAKAIKELDRELQPARDLWPGIERRITDLPHGRGEEWMTRWVPVGIAASLVLATSALLVSLYGAEFSRPRQLTFEQSMTQMEAEYRRVRVPLMRQFEEENQSIDPELAELVYRNLEIIDAAKAELERALERDPENPRLLKMLMRVNRQELDLLTRDLARANRSI